ncbi:unnamed protein product [Owenia fusiformis]|uniref:Methyltransferase type 11 domain-containing protein n=1 Tax=Owenia fusiformis TaxID=6347 RepID=A0A8S4NB03_OWEFU|nr:unnamed protein product [Owenia fusiformis]
MVRPPDITWDQSPEYKMAQLSGYACYIRWYGLSKVKDGCSLQESKMLQRLGFTDIDAIDANQAMLDVAKSKNVYNRLICDFLGLNTLDIKNDTYDGAVATGCFNESHVTGDCFPELVRIMKPGGLILIQIRADLLEKMVGFKEAMEQLENDKMWTLVKKEYFPNWYVDKPIDGFRAVFRII